MSPAGVRPTSLLLLQATVGGLPGQALVDLLDALRAAGARDAWSAPALAPDGPTQELSCLADPDRVERLRELLRARTADPVRVEALQRWALPRAWATVDVAGRPVRVKLAVLDGEVVNAAPEFDDCASAAAALGLPVREVFARAELGWRAQPDGGG